ncbi:hypothetical protein QE382_002485 [Sphingobacterium zeae]|uniref:Uncharacterized protein n=1 Tax=Sphingobacterium zeae TaxID=1776859 RepID=A0ABU0U6A8_9SPHI|nr:hypothetical protein [Sphingobacterium zeae]
MDKPLFLRWGMSISSAFTKNDLTENPIKLILYFSSNHLRFDFIYLGLVSGVSNFIIKLSISFFNHFSKVTAWRQIFIFKAVKYFFVLIDDYYMIIYRCGFRLPEADTKHFRFVLILRVIFQI